MPSATCGSRHSARSEATSRSQQKVTMQPMPTAKPLTAPMIGLGKLPRISNARSRRLGMLLMKLRGRGHGVGLRILQVGAGREGAAALVAGEDGAADLVVVLHGREVAREALVEVGAPRVAGLRDG